jgi:hypothetical protein
MNKEQLNRKNRFKEYSLLISFRPNFTNVQFSQNITLLTCPEFSYDYEDVLKILKRTKWVKGTTTKVPDFKGPKSRMKFGKELKNIDLTL